MHTITVRSFVTVRFFSTIGEEETALASLLDNSFVTNFKLSSTSSILFLFSSTTFFPEVFAAQSKAVEVDFAAIVA